MTTKRTDELERGDRVTLTGLRDTFTVDRVVPTGYRGCVGNRPILTVWYVEQRAGAPIGNSAADDSLWQIAGAS